MYKVIITDDERQILDGLSKMIKWRDFGFELCGTARNGIEAIQLIKTHKVDLVVTDIRMPKMDGLELLEYVHQNISKEIEFIILSGYSEFQYAQKAMQYNVRSYILKPVDETLLYAALVDIKSKLEEKEIRNNFRIKSCINNIIMGDSLNSNEMILKDEETYGVRYITIERHMEFKSLSGYREEQVTDDLSRMIEEIVGSCNMRFVLKRSNNKCHIIVGRSLLSCFDYDIKHLATSIQRFLSISKAVKTDIIIGKKVDGFKDLHESIQTITKCRHKQFYKADPSILIYEDIKDEEFCKLYEDNGAVIKVISAFRKSDMTKLIKSVEELINHFHSLQVVPEIVMIHMDSIMASIIQILSERMEDISVALDQYSVYKKIHGKSNVFDLGMLVQQFCLFCNSMYASNEKNDKRDIIDKVIRYVDDNYMEHLKITDIAERFFS